MSKDTCHIKICSYPSHNHYMQINHVHKDVILEQVLEKSRMTFFLLLVYFASGIVFLTLNGVFV